MDKNLIKGSGPKRKWLPKRIAKKIVDGVFDGSTWVMSEPKSARPKWLGYCLLDLTINVVPNAQLAEDFASGKCKLVPIIFQHGLGTMKEAYTSFAREFASHGYIVFTYDSVDGTCGYTERVTKENQLEPVRFDRSVPFFKRSKPNEH